MGKVNSTEPCWRRAWEKKFHRQIEHCVSMCAGRAAQSFEDVILSLCISPPTTETIHTNNLAKLTSKLL